MVKTAWWYSTGRTSFFRASTQRALSRDWHLGQWRSRQELYRISRCPQVSQTWTWPPSAAVRQLVIARTARFCWEESPRRRSPCARKTSASSRRRDVAPGASTVNAWEERREKA